MIPSAEKHGLILEEPIWGANEAKHHACLREQTEST